MVKKFILAYLFIFFADFPVYALDLSAECSCLISADTGEIIYSHREREKRPMASTTKIMTGLLASEYGKPEEVVTVSANAESQEGSSIYLRKGEKISLEDLVCGLMLNSGNDAAVAIAEHIGKNVENFAELMTKKAKEIGAENTQFKNPNGLDEEGHYTTAYDLAIIAAYAMKNETFAETVSMKTSTGELESGQILYFKNHNKLLDMYEGANGVKTGFTKASGRCLVSAAQREGVKLIAVTLNAPDDWNDHKKMLDYGFLNIGAKSIVKKNEPLKIMEKEGKKYSFSADRDVKLTTNSLSDFEVVLHMSENIPSPMNKGEKAGAGEIFYKNKKIEEFDILSDEDIPETKEIEKKSFNDCLYRVFDMIM